VIAFEFIIPPLVRGGGPLRGGGDRLFVFISLPAKAVLPLAKRESV
jgi:hypothetical protein